MKNIIPPLFAALLAILIPLQANALDAGVNNIVYATPDQAYIETNIEIAGLSITFKSADALYLQAGVEVLFFVKQGETIVHYDKYQLTSPLVTAPVALLDVRRFMVAPGDYTLDITFTDSHTPANQYQYKKNVTVTLPPGLALSDVLLLRGFREDNTENPFNKNGFYLEPAPFQFFDRESTSISLYAEVYHTDKTFQANEKYQIRYFIEKDNGSAGKELVAAGVQRKSPAPIDAILVQMNITDFSSGNYTLTVELRSPSAELLTSKKVEFQRSNPFLDFKDEEITEDVLSKQFVQNLDYEALRFCLRGLTAAAEGNEATIMQNIINSKELKQMRFYVFRHFARQNPNAPEYAYKQFLENLLAIHNEFKSGFRLGFETDRGRSYLRYGKPDDLIRVEDEPGAFPYEIWVYYTLPKTNQKNVKILYYNPSLAGEDYIILHTNIRGNLSNPKWERELYRRAPSEYTTDNFGDATGIEGNLGRRAKVYFDDL